MSETAEHVARSRRGFRVLRFVLAAFLVVIAIGWIAFAILLHRAQPYLREKIVTELKQRFDADAELGDLSVSVFPELRIMGQNLAVRRQQPNGMVEIEVPQFSMTANPSG